MSVVPRVLFLLCVWWSGSAASEAAPAQPERFAPGVVSTDAYEFALSFRPDGSELFFTRRVGNGPNRIFRATVSGGVVGQPEALPLHPGDYEPFVAPDGQRLYFGRGIEILVCEAEGDGWSEPVPLPAQVNSGFAMAMCADAAGNLYFTGNDGLVCVAAQGGGYADPVSLGPQFTRAAGGAAHGYVDPEAKLLLFDAQGRSEGHGKADLYLSTRSADGGWTAPRNLDVLNSAATEMCPSLSPDGRALFFCREGEIYWVDAGVLEPYRSTDGVTVH